MKIYNSDCGKYSMSQSNAKSSQHVSCASNVRGIIHVRHGDEETKVFL